MAIFLDLSLTFKLKGFLMVKVSKEFVEHAKLLCAHNNNTAAKKMSNDEFKFGVNIYLRFALSES